MNKLFCCYLIFLSFFSCTDTFDEDKYSLGEKQLYLLVSEDNMAFNYEGGNSTIKIEGNTVWYAKVEGEFVTLSKIKGGNNSKRFNEIIDVIVQTNPFAANRKAQILIYNDTNDSLVATISIEQSLNIEEMNKYEAVDLGLSVKWASQNFEVSLNPSIQGLYGWGDITGCLTDTIGNYAQGYNSSISGTQYDVVSQTWGPVWRIPTKAEFQELFDKCEWSFLNSKEFVGFKVTGRNGNYIMLESTNQRVGNTIISNDIKEDRTAIEKITINYFSYLPFPYKGYQSLGYYRYNTIEFQWSHVIHYWTADNDRDITLNAFLAKIEEKRSAKFVDNSGPVYYYPNPDIPCYTGPWYRTDYQIKHNISFNSTKRYVGNAIRPVRTR